MIRISYEKKHNNIKLMSWVQIFGQSLILFQKIIKRRFKASFVINLHKMPTFMQGPKIQSIFKI